MIGRLYNVCMYVCMYVCISVLCMHAYLCINAFPAVRLILIFSTHYEFFQIHNASKKTHKFLQHNPNNPNCLSTMQKKKNSDTDTTQQKQRK